MLLWMGVQGAASAAPLPRRVVRVAPVELKVSSIQVVVPVPSGNPQGGATSHELQQPGEFGTGLTEMFTTSLAQSRLFLVQEGESTVPVGLQLRATVTRLAVHQSAAGVSLGGGTGAKKRARSEVGVDVRLVEQSSGLVVAAVHAVKAVDQTTTTLDWERGAKVNWAQAQGASLAEAARLALGEAVLQLEKQLRKEPWEGLVVQVVQDEAETVLYINAGERAGLQVGDLLEVWSRGVALIDPETKQALGRTPGKRLGRARVRAVSPLLAELVPSGELRCQEGDRVIFLSRALPR